MKRCSEATSDPNFCLDKCGGLHDDSQVYWKDGFVYRYFLMGPYNGASSTTETCSTDMWRSQTKGAYTSCSYDFPSTFYPFSPLCLRGCVPTGTTITNTGLQVTVPSCSGKTFVQGYTKASALPAATQQLSVYTPPAACVATGCTTSSGGYPVLLACSHSTAGTSPSSSPTGMPFTHARSYDDEPDFICCWKF